MEHVHPLELILLSVLHELIQAEDDDAVHANSDGGNLPAQQRADEINTNLLAQLQVKEL
jgi:hypothetical protein